MSDSTCTRCGHEMREHRKPTKRDPQTCMDCSHVGNVNGCPGYTCAVLPEGERLEFGRHRLPQDKAETAPGWPPIR
jgi:hypothetical protein